MPHLHLTVLLLSLFSIDIDDGCGNCGAARPLEVGCSDTFVQSCVCTQRPECYEDRVTKRSRLCIIGVLGVMSPTDECHSYKSSKFIFTWPTCGNGDVLMPS